MAKKNNLTAIIITNPKDPRDLQLLPGSLETLSWCSSILIIPQIITPEIKKIAQEFKANVFKQQGDNFSAWRNFAISKAKTDWVFFIDSDERVTPQLQSEIESMLKNPSGNSGYAIPRSNVILGKEMKHGGWWPDYVLRLIYKPHFNGYHGELHEQPTLKGSVFHLVSPLMHLKHDNLEEMVIKTNNWSRVEAKLLFESNHPPMIPQRFFRAPLTEIYNRLIKKQGIRDGTQGIIDGIYQGFSKFITYIKLWEMQQTNKNG